MPERTLITGASGLLGFALATHLVHRDFDILGVSRTQSCVGHFPNVRLDLTQFDKLRDLVHNLRPTVIVHAAALSTVIPCERSPDEAWLQNYSVTKHLADAANHVSAHLVFISTDQVFDGQQGLYNETALPRPTNVYGKTKRAAEEALSSICKRFLIIRSNNIVGRNFGMGLSFTDKLLEVLLSGRPVTLFTDQIRSPIHLRECVHAIECCLRNRVEGYINLGGHEVQSRYETGLALAQAYNISQDLILPCTMSSHPDRDFLHRDGSFNTTKLRSLFPSIAGETVVAGFRRDFIADRKLNHA
ncbi:SDR family oxidoreductase [bacterium]|nr:SDR family oxidoreductase [bacterium]